MALQIGIVGVSGYSGVELLRILDRHPAVEVAVLSAGKAAGLTLAQSWPGLEGALGGRPIEAFAPETFAGRADIVFLGLPHGLSAAATPGLFAAGVKIVIDLGADFRLQDVALYERTYGVTHPCPELVPDAVYGLPELHRERLRGARLIANPGCYPTAMAIAALPLVEAGLADWLIADCVSGVSGAGRTANARNLYCEVQESVAPYGLAGTHRHSPEIEQTLGIPVTFTPHLVPMRRGMLATVHARPPGPLPSPEALQALFRARYADHPMVVVRTAPPATADVRGTGLAHVFPTADPARGTITVVSAIDNLGKGAASQAVQCMNLAAGLEEGLGLPTFPILP